MKLLYYAIGGGTGHLVRALSILRKFSGCKREVLALSKFVDFVSEKGIKICGFPTKKKDIFELGKKIREKIFEYKPDLLFVDTFPGGCFGELEEIPFKKIFIKRSECFHTGFFMVFDLRKLPPVLIRNFNEVGDRDLLRKKIGIYENEKTLFFYHNTKRDEVMKWTKISHSVSRELGLKFYFSSSYFTNDMKIDGFNLNYFPVMEILPAFDIVVTGGGYNSYFETTTLFNSAIFIPFRRKIDNQYERIDKEKYFLVENGRDFIKILEENIDKFFLKENISFENGADYIFSKVRSHFL